MADDKPAGNGAGKAKSTAGSGGRKTSPRPKAVKPPTLDLKAEEQTASTASASAQKPASDNTAPQGSGSSPDTAKTAGKSQSERSKPDSGPQPSKTAKAGLGMTGYLGAGITGAAAAALVSAGMGAIVLNTPDTSTLQSRIDEVASQAGQTQELQDRITALQAEQTELATRLEAAPQQQDAALDDSALQAMQAALESSIADTQSRFDSLSGRIDALAEEATGSETDTAQTEALRTELETLSERLGATETRFDQIATGDEVSALQTALAEASGEDADGSSGLAGLAELGRSIADQNDAMTTRMDAFEPQLESLTSGVAALEARLGETLGTGASMSDIEAIGERIAAVNREFTEVRDGLSTLQARADATEQILAELDARVTETQSTMAMLQQSLGAVRDDAASGSSSAAAAALAVAGLKDAVLRGAPFADALTTLTALVGEDHGSIPTLSAHAETGVATPTLLAAQFEGLTSQMVAAGSIREDAGILGRLVDNARGIVSVTPVAPVTGDSPSAIVSRIAGRLSDGDLAGAFGEWQSLPEASRKASSEWGAALEARNDVTQALDTMSADILNTLRQTSGAAPATQ
jgi:hypothetical protein